MIGAVMVSQKKGSFLEFPSRRGSRGLRVMGGTRRKKPFSFPTILLAISTFIRVFPLKFWRSWHFMFLQRVFMFIHCIIFLWRAREVKANQTLPGIPLRILLFSLKVSKSQRQIFASKVLKSSKLWKFGVKRAFLWKIYNVIIYLYKI